MKDLKKYGSSDIAVGKERLWLVNIETGHIIQWSPIQAVKQGMVDCDKNGNPINPADVPADHPFILEQTKGTADRMTRAGASPDTLRDFGRQLSEDGRKKFRALEYDKARAKHKALYYDDRDCELVARRMKRTNDRAADAKLELHNMALEACRKLGIPLTMYYEAWAKL